MITVSLPQFSIQDVPSNIQKSLKSFSFRPILAWLKRYWPLLLLAYIAISFVHLLCDVEYVGDDTYSRINAFTSGIQPEAAATRPGDTDIIKEPLFANVDSVSGYFIKQELLYDCKLLATLASFARTPEHCAAIRAMFKENSDGSYTVTFPGDSVSPVTVSPITGRERRIYSRAIDFAGKDAGLWLPVLEKAYGAYRMNHQDLREQIQRTIKHGLLDGRWSAAPELPGYACTFSCKDDLPSKLLTGHGQVEMLETFSMQVGPFGIGKSYVSWRQVRSWWGRGAVFNEFIEEDHKYLVEAMKRNAIVVASTEIQADGREYGLRSSHAYAVMGYNPEKRILVVKDPYANGDFLDLATRRARDGRNDGVFPITLGEFNLFFSHLRIESQQ